MTKGTASMGKRQKKSHVKCRRCGSISFHTKNKACSSCGFGKTSRMRSYKWQEKSVY